MTCRSSREITGMTADSDIKFDRLAPPSASTLQMLASAPRFMNTIDLAVRLSRRRRSRSMRLPRCRHSGDDAHNRGLTIRDGVVEQAVSCPCHADERSRQQA